MNNAQKLFEIGENATLGMLIWGTGGLPVSSFRTLIAKLGDTFAAQPPASVEEAMQRWIDFLWPIYTTELAATIQRGQQLQDLVPHGCEIGLSSFNYRLPKKYRRV